MFGPLGIILGPSHSHLLGSLLDKLLSVGESWMVPQGSVFKYKHIDVRHVFFLLPRGGGVWI